MGGIASEVFAYKSAANGSCWQHTVITVEATPFRKVVCDVESRRARGGIFIVDEGDSHGLGCRV